MSLLSKLFSKKAVNSVLNELANAVNGNNEQQKPAAEPAPQPQPQYAEPAYEQSMGPSGRSWGPVMPNEPNQFNYPGTWYQYFENIYKTEFADYRVESELIQYRKAVFTFYSGDKKALVVEILPSSSEAYRLRKICRAQGIPYLRYYYDHEGWWNTRSYVIDRTRGALRS